MKSDELQSTIAANIRQARAELRVALGEKKLFGFALCTDDDVRTLGHIACTREWVHENKKSDPDEGYIFVAWDTTATESLFDQSSATFAKLANIEYSSDAAWGEARNARFEMTVLALKACRDEGIFDSDTLLCVGSTDPSYHMEALAMNAVDRLNLSSVADSFARALGYSKYRDQKK